MPCTISGVRGKQIKYAQVIQPVILMNAYLNMPEKKAKMSKLKERVHVAEKQVQKPRATIRNLTQKQGESVDNDLCADLIGIMNENCEQVKKAFPEGSFARLFWEEQLQAVPIKNPRQIRWHPLMIKWCLNLKLISGEAYKLILPIVINAYGQKM